jgi:hypothetical protein
MGGEKAMLHALLVHCQHAEGKVAVVLANQGTDHSADIPCGCAGALR